MCIKRSGPMCIILLSLWNADAPAQRGDVGLGVILGEPTGVSGKVWTSRRTAFAGGVAWSFARESAMHVHTDWLVHDFRMFNLAEGELPFYYGIGGRLKFNDTDESLGARIPIGIEYLFDDHPITMFFEVAPILDLIPSTEFNVNGAIGARIMLR